MDIRILKFKIEEKHRLLNVYIDLYNSNHNSYTKSKLKEKIDELLKDINMLIDTKSSDIDIIDVVDKNSKVNF